MCRGKTSAVPQGCGAGRGRWGKAASSLEAFFLRPLTFSLLLGHLPKAISWVSCKTLAEFIRQRNLASSHPEQPWGLLCIIKRSIKVLSKTKEQLSPSEEFYYPLRTISLTAVRFTILK